MNFTINGRKYKHALFYVCKLREMCMHTKIIYYQASLIKHYKHLIARLVLLSVRLYKHLFLHYFLLIEMINYTHENKSCNYLYTIKYIRSEYVNIYEKEESMILSHPSSLGILSHLKQR